MNDDNTKKPAEVYEREILELKDTIAQITKLYLEALRGKDDNEHWLNKAYDKQSESDKYIEVLEKALDIISCDHENIDKGYYVDSAKKHLRYNNVNM